MGGWTGVGKDKIKWDGVISINGEPTEAKDLVNKKYVDDEIITHDVANEHIDWTSTTEDLETTGTGTFGALVVDTNILVVDAVNNRVGIGTAVPNYTLEINGNVVNQNTQAFGTRLADTTPVLLFSVSAANDLAIGSGAIQNTVITTGASMGFSVGGYPIAVIIENATGRVGIGTGTPAAKLDVNGAIVSATATLTASSDDYDVSGINTLFIAPASAAVVLGGLKGGVAGQVLNIAITGIAYTTTIENVEGVGTQDIYLCDESDDTLDAYGGWTLVCDGTKWYDCSHAKHV